MLPSIDIRELVKDLLPSVFKSKFMLINNLYQLLVSAVKPVDILKDDLTAYRTQILHEISYTGQVISLEHQLNKHFGLPFPITTNGSIWIGDGENPEEVYLFRGEQSSSLLYEPNFLFRNDQSIANPDYVATYLYSSSQLNNDFYDFTVNFPYSLYTNDNLNYITGVINKYKLAGYTYRLIPYNEV